jgi:hypothetical protein
MGSSWVSSWESFYKLLETTLITLVSTRNGNHLGTYRIHLSKRAFEGTYRIHLSKRAFEGTSRHPSPAKMPSYTLNAFHKDHYKDRYKNHYKGHHNSDRNGRISSVNIGVEPNRHRLCVTLALNTTSRILAARPTSHQPNFSVKLT